MNSPAKILLVDDDDDLRDVLQIILESGGYHVVESRDCTTAIRLLKEERFDIVLLDIGLPDGSGFNILEFVKESCPSSKVIMVTGTVGLANAIKSATLGVSDYITKPFTPHYLLRSIDHALSV